MTDLEPECSGPNSCHGCMQWCDDCGDVSRACDAEACDAHRCQLCNAVRIDNEQERDISYTCFVCDPASFPRRWPAFTVMEYAHAVLERNPNATDLLHDLLAGIARIAYGVTNDDEFHPHRLARELGFLPHADALR